MIGQSTVLYTSKALEGYHEKSNDQELLFTNYTIAVGQIEPGEEKIFRPEEL
jgi:hypothetical protein